AGPGEYGIDGLGIEVEDCHLPAQPVRHLCRAHRPAVRALLTPGAVAVRRSEEALLDAQTRGGTAPGVTRPVQALMMSTSQCGDRRHAANASQDPLAQVRMQPDALLLGGGQRP